MTGAGSIPDISPADEWDFSLQELNLPDFLASLDPILGAQIPSRASLSFALHS